MRRRWFRSSRVYFVTSIALAVTTGLLVHGYLGRLADAAGMSTVTEEIDVVAAARPIARGSAVQEAWLELRRMPTQYAPPGALQEISKAAGRVTLSDLAQGEVVTDTRLARVRAGPVASLVPEGLRAFAVPTSLPPGAVAPGDHVDVLATFGSGQPYTETVVEGVEVLLVLGGDPRTGSDEGGGIGLDVAAAGIGTPLTLILLVAPQQQEDLAFARAFADLSVSIAPAEEPAV